MTYPVPSTCRRFRFPDPWVAAVTEGLQGRHDDGTHDGLDIAAFERPLAEAGIDVEDLVDSAVPGSAERSAPAGSPAVERPVSPVAVSISRVVNVGHTGTVDHDRESGSELTQRLSFGEVHADQTGMTTPTTHLEAPTPEDTMKMIKDVPLTRRWRTLIETIAAAAPEPVKSQAFYQPPLNWTPSILEGVHHSLHLWVNAVLPRCPWEYQLTADQEPVEYRMKPSVATIVNTPAPAPTRTSSPPQR